MVSFQKMIEQVDDSSKKRKWPEEVPKPSQQFPDKPSKSRNMYSIFDTDLIETPLPLEWQRYLDIKSGQIYYINLRTNKRTSKDPRTSPEPPSPKHMSLDLELNLPCGPSSVGPNDHHHHHHHVDDNFTKNTNNSGGGSSGGLRRSPSWLACDQGDDDDQQEMVTAVCKRCHMLVMMYKSTPACPNCKFMHPPDQTPPGLGFNNNNNRGLSLLC